MKTGKVSQAVLDRSILRPLRMAGVLGEDARFGSDSARITSQETSEGAVRCASVSGTVTGTFDRTAEMMICQVQGSLAADGADIKAVQTGLIVPESLDEKILKKLEKEIAAVCSASSISVIGGHTEASDAVTRPVLTVTGFGFEQKNEKTETAIAAGDAIVMAGAAACAGTAILTCRGRDELEKRYAPAFVDDAAALGKHVSDIGKIRKIISAHGKTMHDISQGGVFGALWELGEKCKSGFRIDLRKILLYQESVEICEYYDLNPYLLYSLGSCLIVTDEAQALVHSLQEAGVPAAVLGTITEGAGRELVNEDEIRYLEKPQGDSLWEMADRRKKV